MAKPEWGMKRTCQSCGARFYDLLRSPIVCPKCGAVVETETAFRPGRHPAAATPEIKEADKALDETEPKAEAEDSDSADEEEDSEVDAGSDEERGLIEDASDLGEDDDDMAEVMEHLDDELDDEV